MLSIGETVETLEIDYNFAVWLPVEGESVPVAYAYGVALVDGSTLAWTVADGLMHRSTVQMVVNWAQSQGGQATKCPWEYIPDEMQTRMHNRYLLLCQEAASPVITEYDALELQDQDSSNGSTSANRWQGMVSGATGFLGKLRSRAGK